MGLPWVRLETGFPTNPKVLGLIADKHHPAVVAYVCSLSYSGGQGLDGFIPRTALPFIHATKRIAEQLVLAGLWEPVEGGWRINGWLEFQVSSEEHERRRARAQALAMMRWHGKPDA